MPRDESPLTRTRLLRDLAALGLAQCDLVMVHASMRAVGPVLGGPDVVIAALRETVGDAGTVMAYVDWEHGVQAYTREDAPEPIDPELLDEAPPFDPKTSRAVREYGVLPEFVRTTPGARRSGNPDASVAAIGRLAEWICADHPLHYGYGPGSPLAKLVEAGGKVLLLGAPLDTVTLLHHSEHVARLPNKRVIRYREPILVAGETRWVDIEEFDTSEPVVAGPAEDYFGEIVRDYLGRGSGRSGCVGRADAHLLDAAELHRDAVQWLESRWGDQAKR